MGSCSCVCNEHPERSIVDIKSVLNQEPKPMKKSMMQESLQSTSFFSQDSQIVLQNISRGYLARLYLQQDFSQFKKEREEREFLLKSAQPEHRLTMITSNLLEIFETSLLKKAQEDLGPVDLSNKIGDGVKTKLKPAFALPDGSFYKGEWDLYGNMHGRGHLVLSDKSHYIGYFRNGEIDLWGRFIYSNSDLYQGDLEKGKEHGTGILRKNNGEFYEGEFIHGQKDGKGRESIPDREEYYGMFSEGKRSGNGVLTLANGDCFQGTFSNGDLHGYGEFKSCNGHSYKGYWKDGQKHGKGVLKTKDGVYEGEFVDNLKHGYGRFDFPDGKTYEGQWKSDRQHGEGWLVLNDIAMKALWKHGNRVKWIKDQ